MSDKAQIFATYWRALAPGRPEPEAEYKFHATRKFRFDFAWPEHRLALEVDGGQFAPGGGRHAKDTDRAKLNLAAILGWRVMRYSPQMLLEDPAACIVQVCMALESKDAS
jgi:very-short-patch-repair endonuclease